MKVDVLELKKALKFFEQNGNPMQLSFEFSPDGHKLLIKSYTDTHGQATITVFDEKSNKMSEKTITDRL